MLFRKIPSGYILRLLKGEEIITALTQFVQQENVRGGGFTALGAMADITLGYFDTVRREYVRRHYPGDYEIGNLTGNIAWLDNKPVIHAHCTISGPDLNAHTGHLFSGTVAVTCEITLVASDTPLLRQYDPDLGFNLLAL